MTDEDVRRTIEAAPLYCNPVATVLWSRARREPDLVPSVQRWFSESGFTSLAVDDPVGSRGAVGANLLTKDPASVAEPAWPVFTFVK